MAQWGPEQPASELHRIVYTNFTMRSRESYANIVKNGVLADKITEGAVLHRSVTCTKMTESILCHPEQTNGKNTHDELYYSVIGCSKQERAEVTYNPLRY